MIHVAEVEARVDNLAAKNLHTKAIVKPFDSVVNQTLAVSQIDHSEVEIRLINIHELIEKLPFRSDHLRERDSHIRTELKAIDDRMSLLGKKVDPYLYRFPEADRDGKNWDELVQIEDDADVVRNDMKILEEETDRAIDRQVLIWKRQIIATTAVSYILVAIGVSLTFAGKRVGKPEEIAEFKLG